MKEIEKPELIGVREFFSPKGLGAACSEAKKYLGEGGRIGTMEDFARILLSTNSWEQRWRNNYYTTLTGEYYGIGKSGKLILIDAPGVGPMADVTGIEKAYELGRQNEAWNCQGAGLISQEEFLALESGEYGKVHIIHLDDYKRRRSYPFIAVTRRSEMYEDSVALARFGKMAKKCLQELPGNRMGACNENPFVVHTKGASNCEYYRAYHRGDRQCENYSTESGYRMVDKGYALAHLVSTEGICRLNYGGRKDPVLTTSCWEWQSSSVRVIGIKAKNNLI
jgi:hypothetical protein